MDMLLAGQWVQRDKTIDVRDPFDDSLIDVVPAATAEDVETAIAAADAARGTARSMSAYERSQILLDTRDEIGHGDTYFSAKLLVVTHDAALYITQTFFKISGFVKDLIPKARAYITLRGTFK